MLRLSTVYFVLVSICHVIIMLSPCWCFDFGYWGYAIVFPLFMRMSHCTANITKVVVIGFWSVCEDMNHIIWEMMRLLFLYIWVAESVGPDSYGYTHVTC